MKAVYVGNNEIFKNEILCDRRIDPTDNTPIILFVEVKQ